MWFLLVLYVLPAAYAASKVEPHYGFLAGCATMAAVLAMQTALLTWGSAWVKRRRGVVEPPDMTAPPVSTDSLEDEPVDEPDDAPDVPLQYGEQARFKQLVLIADAARPDVTRSFYDNAKRTIEAYLDVETGRDGSGAAMVSTAELAPEDGLSAAPPDETLTVFVSNDGAWSGFRVGDNSFRFRHGAITRLRLTQVIPVRWKGGYMVTFWFDVPNRKSTADYESFSTWFYLAADYSGRRSRALTHACREVASVLDVAFDVDETGDD
ncbi:hypothetical protein BLA14095_00069 [Burkholderia lata]|uniref:hypothetical protein n=1 Tax=Burkholderia lata (strain ATCC 17760 / DSM 23089 / LMG 22485 / NCIMB 9086 / R18194 / 383) TaxID=482957 RepID=UPI0014546C0C|nr:hypothetical protein [Burkholderia lata]VWB08097.1 hypothetical protein BLA14095_00069 [Burkholderia lata]